MTPLTYVLLTFAQSVISIVLFFMYRAASATMYEAEEARRKAVLKAADAETARGKAVYEKHRREMELLSQKTSREEVVRAVETLAAALTPRAAGAEACGSADKRPAKRPRRH